MRPFPIEPTRYRLSTLLALDNRAVHELALRAVGTVTSYNVSIGRCLLAMRESRGYLEFGCSCETHYARAKLGLSKRTANSCKRVARVLLGLPALSLAAERGQIAWGKLREMVRKATPQTEEYWLELSRRYTYKQIQALVSRTPKGALPGDVDVENDSYHSELRCALSPEVFAMLDQARRMFSLEREQAVTTAEVLEQALVSFISGQPLDEESLRKIREEADKDLQAERARLIPVVAEARELAEEMGILDSPEDLNRARVGPTKACEVESSEHQCCSSQKESYDTNLARVGSPELAALIQQAIKGNSIDLESLSLYSVLENPLNNTRIRINPENRSLTKTQKKELLRRDGWCCSSPGCPNRVWLHIHHLESYAEGGKTEPSNLIGLCTACHRNVHRGILTIRKEADGRVVFRDQHGYRLDEQADLVIAGWLDWEIGWIGHPYNSYGQRYGTDWAVFAA